MSGHRSCPGVLAKWPDSKQALVWSDNFLFPSLLLTNNDCSYSGIGDLTVSNNRAGCAELLTAVMDRVRPKFHVFGHIHEAYGMWRNKDTTFINAATCDRGYKLVHDPVVFDFLPPTTNKSSGLLKSLSKCVRPCGSKSEEMKWGLSFFFNLWKGKIQLQV